MKNNLKKAGCFILILFLLNISLACNKTSGKCTVSVVLYDGMLDPKSTLDSIVNQSLQLTEIDSIKVIGQPLDHGVYDISIDSVRVRQFGISFDSVDAYIAQNVSAFDPMVFLQGKIVSNDSLYIPFQSIAELSIKSEPYRHDIYLQDSVQYSHNDRDAVKVRFYISCKKKKKTIQLIDEIVNRQFTLKQNFGYPNEYQIIVD